mgnify:CR=1 FL=1
MVLGLMCHLLQQRQIGDRLMQQIIKMVGKIRSLFSSWRGLTRLCVPVSAASLFTADEFLSAAEVAHVLGLVERCCGWVPSATGGKHYEVPSLDDFEMAARADPIIWRIESRIDEATGVGPHRHEDILSLARITSEGRSPRGGHFPPFGLHHDSDTRPARVWTVLVYLQLPADGGRTIFPLRGIGGRHRRATQQSERHRMFQSELLQHFGGAPDYSRQVGFDRYIEHPFMDLLEEACRGEYGASFLPAQVGGALMFKSGGKNRLTWHAGCNVLDGSKTILQKFKEAPWDERRIPTHSSHTRYRPLS